ncbi:ribonuclease R [Candidatus Pseudoscillospira sp. SGI.172]|uniref:ribonuclease R n=1 Tax=Candidatus Pseudoscillospira sp. SGI.172 TaxID=3420582 RepID=UPI003CFE53E1
MSMTGENKIKGRYQGSGRGFGFLIPEDGQGRSDDCFVPPRRENGAWDGDTVEGELLPADPTRPDRSTARITKILSRGNQKVVGTIRKADREVWLQPDSDRLPLPIKVVGKTRVRNGEKAAVAVTSYGSDTRPPLGTVVETFGPAGTRAAAVESILYQQNIQRDFPQPVLDEASAIRQSVPAAARRNRLDLREKCVITIDGASSKDLDDAVSLERDGANWLLGVHIADVSHYVQPGTPLDEEAFTRGTSVYFADQVVPMLPVALSNGICSLNPQVDRLTLSCLMTLSPDGAMLDHSIAQSVIRSAERMTYEDCNVLLAGGDAALEARYAHILPMLRDMAALARALEKRRKARGSLDLDSSESYIHCDGEGRPVDIEARTQGESEGLIESFMLAANETVARHLFDLKKPAVYRVHEKPSPDKTETLKAMLSPLGYALREADNFSLQKVLEASRDKPEAPAVSTMVLRSLMKARYDTENLGHFGLAAPYYCHFTSPIRRYPDLMVHRCLHALLAGKLGPRSEKKLAKSCEKAAVQSSQRELAAQTAERDIDKLYFAEYMEGHLGESFQAAVSGVTKFGLFAALPSGVEGLIPVESLPDDHYAYDETRMTLTGEHTGRSFTFGMELTVVCVAADASTGRIDFRLPGQENAPGRSEPAPRPQPQARPERSRSDRRNSGRSGKRRGGKPAMHVPKPRKKGKKK